MKERKKMLTDKQRLVKVNRRLKIALEILESCQTTARGLPEFSKFSFVKIYVDRAAEITEAARLNASILLDTWEEE